MFESQLLLTFTGYVPLCPMEVFTSVCMPCLNLRSCLFNVVSDKPFIVGKSNRKAMSYFHPHATKYLKTY